MKSLRRIRNRAKRCYELAFKVMLDEPAGARLRLVHGWCAVPTDDKYFEPAIVYGHAWILLPSGRVYDVIKDEYFSAHDYAVKHHAIIGRVYTRKQTARLGSRHRHSGPWFTDKEMCLHIVAGLPTGFCRGKLPRRWW
jgi:hypothetical protein